MKNDNRVGDIVLLKDFSGKWVVTEKIGDDFLVEEEENGLNLIVKKEQIVNLSLTGRKAALASSKKVGRDSKGRFSRKEKTHGLYDHDWSVVADSYNKKYYECEWCDATMQQPKEQMKQPKYENCGGANGCNGTC